AEDVRGERGVDRIAERIEDGRDLGVDVVGVLPRVGHGDRDQLGERARPLYAYALGVRAEVAPSRQTVSASAADHVPFAAHAIAREEVVHVRADRDDPPGEL